MKEPLRISYLLEAAPLFGGVKVVLRQANLLVRLGHRVTVVCPGEPPDWFPLEAELLRTPGLDPHDLPPSDVLIATYWTTIHRALEGVAAGRSREVAHYCQGYEGSYTHNLEQHREIEQAYTRPTPALAVSAHLARLVRDRFGRPARVVPQPLEPAFQPTWRWRPRRVPRILVMSPFEIDWKGVSTALRAVVELRRRGFACELVRLSQWPLSDAERDLLEPDAFHEHLAPSEVPDLVRSCDLLLAPSWEQEGFGLPVLEAMASGVPVVASDIAAFRDFAVDAARLVPFDQPDAFADAAQEILDRPRAWRRARRAGIRVAESFREERAAQEAAAAVRWVASGAWREELGQR